MTITILTPAQFQVARALADAHGHTWGGVPDGTLRIEEIAAWSDEASPDWVGIEYPDMDEEGTVVHLTGTGRLKWRVLPTGNVFLEVFRPGGIQVAHITVINGDDGGDSDTYHQDELEILVGFSSREEAYEDDGLNLRDGRNYVHDLRDELLFVRHVEALVRPMVALLTANTGKEEGEDSDAWRARVIIPAIARAQEILAPLFKSALPDGIALPFRFSWEDIQDRPGTGYSHREVYEIDNNYSAGNNFCLYEVHHGVQVAAVESERAAVHATLLLRQNSDMAIQDAVEAANRSRHYRPVAGSRLVDA